jgi:hypothetical protein
MNAAYAKQKRSLAREHAAASAVPYVRVQPVLEQDLPPSVYRLALFCWALFLSSFVLTFWASGHTMFMIAICAVYAVMFFGVPYVMWREAKKARPELVKPDLPLGDFLRRDLATIDGPAHGLDAVVQVVLVPACLSLGCMAIGTIITLARAGAY